jgi:predicted metalloprotease with PDZ domain
MHKLLGFIAILYLAAACSPRTGDTISKDNMQDGVEEAANEIPVSSFIDLTQTNQDRVWVEIDPGKFFDDSLTFRLPRVVQGTYDVSNFGSFTDSLIAYDYQGNTMDARKDGPNTWIIPAADFDKLGYYVNDTFDIERTEKPTPFSPSGTNIAEDNFVLNLHGFVGYFETLQNNGYELQITAPADYKKTSALPVASTTYSRDSTTVTNTYTAERYFDITDNPMFYGDLDVEEFQVGDITIVLSVYSPTGSHSAARIKETVATMMEAQREYLGDLETTDRYDIYLFLAPQNQSAPTGFGALEHHTSTVVVLPEGMPAQNLSESMTDVVSHEFFHIVTPLNVHSEDIHNFDYNDPTFSKHLWMYEGVTEYFASHFQIYENLQPKDAFYKKMSGKIASASTMNDSQSFTTMSANVLEEPYASNFYNVYQKGALIGMCIDILMRQESNGERSMLSLMKQLSAKYGKEKPFKDDTLIHEITDMTYPSVGDFLQTHVAGNTPIDYSEFFEKVGLQRLDEKAKTTLFLDGQTPFVDVNQSTQQLYFRDMQLNSSLVELGVKSQDIIKSINSTEYTLANIRELIPASMQWTPETDIEMVLERDGEEMKISGKVGTPTVTKQSLVEMEDATEEQLKLRKQWLGN